MKQPTPKTSEMVLVCNESDVPFDGTVVTRVVKGRTIAFARGKSAATNITAFDSRCPHMRGPLKFGRVVDGEVVCPWHFLRFDIATGATVGCESIMHLKTFDVCVTDGIVYVAIDV
ncbi:Rieske (2Fe-2S) protein [Caballeronia sp. J97]|uniref:Rieske (2Fe-2S) protein n=1 Tax=Caballeronia sp. J97 TaxID=2805429 RepID=UPI002AB17F1C|nr:Rieske 2Fe-2S domain-containing protein [Caballeronia sp. J97]